jgi:hypothetical protein
VSEEVVELHSNQEDAEIKIVLHTLHASKHSQDYATVTVQSPNTDVFVLLLHFYQKIHRRWTLLIGTSGGC